MTTSLVAVPAPASAGGESAVRGPRSYYLAGPMSGYPDGNYPAFTAAAAALRRRGYTVVSPHELHGGDVTLPYAHYIREDLRALLECDAIVLLPGWQNSRGAVLEQHTAHTLGLPMVELDEQHNLHPFDAGTTRGGQPWGTCHCHR